MVVVSMTNCPPKLRGDLSKWLLEINTGVYVGHINAKVRELLWERICDNIGNGQATMVFSTNNEQHLDFYVHNTTWKPVDFDGIKLMKHLSTQNNFDSNIELKSGFSNISKRRIGKRRRNNILEQDYIIVDIETTGLDYKIDEIVEIGAIKVLDKKSVNCYNWLINIDRSVPTNIQNLTGITSDELHKNGVELKTALLEFFELITEQKIFIYNAGFDLKFLETSAIKCGLEFPDISVRDILFDAKSKLKGIENYKLQTVANSLGIDRIQTHRAIDDCKLLNDVYFKLNEI